MSIYPQEYQKWSTKSLNMLIYADNVALNRYKQRDLIHITICGRMGSTDGGHFYTITIRHIAIGF